MEGRLADAAWEMEIEERRRNGGNLPVRSIRTRETRHPEDGRPVVHPLPPEPVDYNGPDRGDPIDLTTRATLEAVAKGYHDHQELQVKQRKTMALMLKLCIMRVESTDSRKRREGIVALKELHAIMEKNP